MKKYFIILLLIIFIPSIKAECDYNKEVELSKEASEINYVYEYNYDNKKFTIKLYNVNKELYLMYNGMVLNSSTDNDNENVVTIDNIKEGEYLSIVVKSSVGSCYQSIMTIYVNLPYYNEYYKSNDCKGYEDKIKICSEEFLTYKPNSNLLKDAINNYNNSIPNQEKQEEEKETTFFEEITNQLIIFVKKWGIKIALSLSTIIICVVFFQSKIRKIKHGL